GATFVLADRDHGTAEWRSQNESHRANSDRKTKQNEVIEVVGVRQDVDLEEPKMERLAGESTQAVIAAGERAPLQRNIIKHLTESDGDHREIDTSSASDQRTQQRADDSAEQHAHDKRHRCACRQEFERESCSISAKAEIGSVTER